MLLIHNGVPTPVTHKVYSVNGFVRVFHKFTGKYLTSLPAAMVRRKKDTHTNREGTWRLSDYTGPTVLINDVLHILGPHSYAYYLSPSNEWKESASISNKKLVELTKPKEQPEVVQEG